MFVEHHIIKFRGQTVVELIGKYEAGRILGVSYKALKSLPLQVLNQRPNSKARSSVAYIKTEVDKLAAQRQLEQLCDFCNQEPRQFQIKHSCLWCCKPHPTQCAKRRKEISLHRGGAGDIAAADEKRFKIEAYCQAHFNRSYPECSFIQKRWATNFVTRGTRTPHVESMERTCLARYGVSNYAKTDEHRKKLAKFNSSALGKSIRAKASLKAKQTCIERYGFENWNQLPEIRIKNTQKQLSFWSSMSKAEYARRLEAFKLVDWSEGVDKAQQTCLKRYGVRNPMHCHRIYSTYMKFRRYDYALPSGKVIQLQGYEKYAFDYMLSFIDESDLDDSPKRLHYSFCGSSRLYTPDAYVRYANALIEVKSTYTLRLDWDKNIAKAQACIAQGFRYFFLIVTDKIHEIGFVSLDQFAKELTSRSL